MNRSSSPKLSCEKYHVDFSAKKHFIFNVKDILPFEIPELNNSLYFPFKQCFWETLISMCVCLQLVPILFDVFYLFTF